MLRLPLPLPVVVLYRNTIYIPTVFVNYSYREIFSKKNLSGCGITQSPERLLSITDILYFGYSLFFNIFYLPVNRRFPVFFQECIGLAERLAAKESLICRQRTWMWCL